MRLKLDESRAVAIVTFLLLFGVTVTGIFAAEPTPPYSLSDLIRLALERNPGIAAAKSGIEVATFGIEEARGERLPVITFGSGYLYAPAERKRLIPRSQLSDLSRRGKVFNEQIIDLGAVLTIPVYTGGRISANIELNPFFSPSLGGSGWSMKTRNRGKAAIAYSHVQREELMCSLGIR